MFLNNNALPKLIYFSRDSEIAKHLVCEKKRPKSSKKKSLDLERFWFALNLIH